MIKALFIASVLSVPGMTVASAQSVPPRQAAASPDAAAKLASIVIPRIEFRQTRLTEAVDFLRQESRRLDPDKQGVNIIVPVTLTPPPAASSTAAPDATAAPAPAAATVPVPRVTLNLNHIPLGEALKYIAAQSGLKVKVEPYAVSLVPLSEPDEPMKTTTFHVGPALFGPAAGEAGK